MRCPFCGASNRAGAGFCLECGESLDATTLAARGGPRAEADAGGPRGRARWAGLGAREVLLGLALLCVVLVADHWNSEQQAARDRQAVAYRRGLGAVGAQHWAEAVTAFGEAGDYKDAARRRAEAAQTVARLTARWTAAQAAEHDGAWWAALLDYGTVAAIQPDYPDVVMRRDRARTFAGPLLYRVPAAPGDAALWWAAADGFNPRPIPGSDANSQIHGISPDGRWAIYSLYMVESATLYQRVPYLLDLQTGATVPLVVPPGTRPGVMSAEFRADSSGVWWQVDDQLFYAALPAGTGPATPLSLEPCLPGIVARDPARGATVLLGHDQHTPTPGVPAWLDPPDSTVLLIGDAQGRNAQVLTREAGTVEEVAFSPGGRYLTYRVTEALAGSRAVLDTLVLFDLSVLEYYPGADKRIGRQVVESGRTGQSEWVYHTLHGRFVPGADPASPRLLITQADGPAVIYDAATGTRHVLTTTAADRTWHLAASPPAVSPGGRWLALEVWSATGNTILSRLVVQPTTGGPAWSMLVPADLPTWVGFSGDERYAFYALSGPDSAGEQHSRLMSVPVPDGAGGPDVGAIRPLIDHRLPAPSWLGNVALTPDGRHLLALLTPMQTSAVPGAATQGPGLYALRPDGADWQLLASQAIEFWVAAGQPWAVPGVP